MPLTGGDDVPFPRGRYEFFKAEQSLDVSPSPPQSHQSPPSSIHESIVPLLSPFCWFGIKLGEFPFLHDSI